MQLLTQVPMGKNNMRFNLQTVVYCNTNVQGFVYAFKICPLCFIILFMQKVL